MALQLPEDILHVICEELLRREDLATLFSCAVSSKHLAPLALGTLYRMHHRAGPDDDESFGLDSNSLLSVQKWSIAWRSIILSTLDQTLFPYYRYLRLLDLRDFRLLLDDSRFPDRIAKVFFSGAMKRFHRTRQYSTAKGVKRPPLDITPIVEAVGDAIAAKAYMVEQLSGEFSSPALLRWVPNMPRLQRLELWNGEPLADDAAREAIYSNCPNFDSLSIYSWAAPNSDEQLGEFIRGLPAQTLRSFVTIGPCGISTDTCTALTKHSEALTELSLSLHQEGVPALVLLAGCVSIERLKLEMPPLVDLEGSHNDVYNEVMSWLRNCTSLKSIELHEAGGASNLLTPLLLSDSIRLEELTIAGKTSLYMMKDNMTLHQTLANQKSLRSLDLLGDADGTTRDDVDALVESLCQLTSLRQLKLRGVSDYFSDEAIISVLASLSQLEEVYISGLSSNDDVLDAVPGLRNLRSISFAGLTAFTSPGLMSMIAKLGGGNQGLEFAVPLADPDSLIPEHELNKVRNAIYEKVGGRLEYVPLRDPDVSEFEGESD